MSNPRSSQFSGPRTTDRQETSRRRRHACGSVASRFSGRSSCNRIVARVDRMEGGGFGFPFGGDPEEIMRGLREFAEQQAESVQEAQREQFATLTLNTAVELTAAALMQQRPEGCVCETSAASCSVR